MFLPKLASTGKLLTVPYLRCELGRLSYPEVYFVASYVLDVTRACGARFFIVRYTFFSACTRCLTACTYGLLHTHLRSCDTQALSRGDGPLHSFRVLA